ncbi:MAG: hypothetical protein KGI75_23735 [Rhizobiaceae bacterium]|nr:hypothetical protein [Rhizobiaceae bacterium]
MSLKTLSLCLFALGLTASAAAASSNRSGSDADWGNNSPASNSSYRNIETDGSSGSSDDEKDPNACWTLPRSADGKSIVPPSQANPVVPRKCN